MPEIVKIVLIWVGISFRVFKKWGEVRHIAIWVNES